MARTKKTGKKAAKQAPTTQLPKGFTPIARRGQSWPNENTRPGDMLVGIIIEFDEIEFSEGRKKRTTQIAKIETEKGEVFTFWESATSAPLFEYEEGTEVAIIFDGYGEKKKGRNPAKLFRIGVNEG